MSNIFVFVLKILHITDKKLLQDGTKVEFYRDRENELLKYFATEKDFVYCNDILIRIVKCDGYDIK